MHDILKFAGFFRCRALGDAIQMKSEHEELLFKYAWRVHKLVHEHVMGGALVSKEALCYCKRQQQFS